MSSMHVPLHALRVLPSGLHGTAGHSQGNVGRTGVLPGPCKADMHFLLLSPSSRLVASAAMSAAAT